MNEQETQVIHSIHTIHRDLTAVLGSHPLALQEAGECETYRPSLNLQELNPTGR